MNGKNVVDGNVTGLTDYKSNSNRSKENKAEEHKVEKVVKGPVVTRKKSSFDKLKGELISDDAKNIKSYVFGEVLIPAIKKAIPKKEFLMVFTFGEYGRCEHSSNIVGGLSLSFTGFGKE